MKLLSRAKKVKMILARCELCKQYLDAAFQTPMLAEFWSSKLAQFDLATGREDQDGGDDDEDD